MSPRSVAKLGIHLFFCLATLLFLNAAGAAQIGGVDPDPGDGGTGGANTIAGNVYFPSGRKVDRQIRVRLSTSRRGELTTVTDDNGAFSFRRLAGGSYVVIIDGEKEYEPVNEPVDIFQPDRRSQSSSGQTITLQIRLKLKASTDSKPEVVSADFANVPPPALEFYRKAQEFAQASNHKAAIEQLREAIKIDPNFALAYNELGVQYLRLAELEKAHRALDSALKLAPAAFAPLLNRGIVFVMMNRDKDAEPDLRAAVTQNDESAVAHFFLGRTLARLRRFAEGEANLVRALSLGGDDVKEAHRYLGAIYNDRGDDAKAIAELEAYVRLVPAAKDADQIRKIIQQLKQASSATAESKRNR